ncbi:MAG TPA: ADP-ribosylglycohydrolase family protein [Chthonomonadales bacterium]|nr:ADP-ribosylglycohydrolase family protein [Chthonomonadales bacterium]
MPRLLRLAAAAALIAAVTLAAHADSSVRRISLAEYRSRMEAGWIGQMAGVAWGAPTEFVFIDRIIPRESFPAWRPELINDAFNQDDLYVEMTFLRTLEQHGLNVSIRQAGIDFANTRYPLWAANNAGRTNLRRGIAPPDSSHPRFNPCPNDIDYQIEADYSGLIAPGLPNAAVRFGEKFGRLMNYGDGKYAGQFIGALYAEAFFSRDLRAIVRRAAESIPFHSQYAEMVRDVLALHERYPRDWEAAWRAIQRKYRENPHYQQASNGPIDCRINGAYVVLGLLWGEGDPDRTIEISCRAGMDSDCNPSSAAGVLFTTLGMEGVPARFHERLDRSRSFLFTDYSFARLLDVCEQLTRAVVRRHGGRVVREGGEEVLVIPVEKPRPSRFELSWDPGPIANSRFTPAEMRRITVTAVPEAAREGLAAFAPGWTIASCGQDMNPGLKAELRGKRNVLLTHPLDQTTGCVLSRTVAVPRGQRTELHLVVGHHEAGDWELIVRANGNELLRRAVGPATARDGWMEATVDLTPFAGRRVRLELINAPTGWAFEAGYWARISVESR